MSIPSPAIQDGIPTCRPTCPAYRRPSEKDATNAPRCEITTDDWPAGRICRPGIQRWGELLERYRELRLAVVRHAPEGLFLQELEAVEEADPLAP